MERMNKSQELLNEFLDAIHTWSGYEFNVPHGTHLDTQLDSFLAKDVTVGIEFIMTVEDVFGVMLDSTLGLTDSKLRALTMGDVMLRVIAARERDAETKCYQHPLDKWLEDNDFTNKPPAQTVTISQEEYERLLDDSKALAQLREIFKS